MRTTARASDSLVADARSVRPIELSTQYNPMLQDIFKSGATTFVQHGKPIVKLSGRT